MSERPWSWVRCLAVGASISAVLNLLSLVSGETLTFDQDLAYSFGDPAARFTIVCRYFTGEVSLRRFAKLFAVGMGVMIVIGLLFHGLD